MKGKSKTHSSLPSFASLALAIFSVAFSMLAFACDPGLAIPIADKQEPKGVRPEPLEKAIFAAGCFWGVEDAFAKVKGVKQAISGFTGGNCKNPSYKLVCSGTTHHAEAVEVEYDPRQVGYKDLLSTFWNMHDPTTLNRQGPDYGEQYRSAIFYLNEEQKKEAIASRDALIAHKVYAQPITTQIVPASEFYPAEEYHQHYFQKHPDVAACHLR